MTITCATQGHLWNRERKCIMCGAEAPVVAKLVMGVGRDEDMPNALVIYCSRRPTDNEMHAIHEAAREALPFDWHALAAVRRQSE